jgi:hypothetical protein
LRITTTLASVAFLIFPVTARSQEAPIKIYIAPLMSALDHRNWFGNGFTDLANAVKVAISQAPFQIVSQPSADALTLTAPDKVKKENEQYMFTVIFSRDGVRLGSAVEYCPIKTLSECTNQLILDTETAAK